MRPESWAMPGQLLLAAAAGAAAVTGFAPFGIGIVPILALSTLFYLWRHASSNARSALLGYVFGLGLMGTGVFWIRISIAQFGGVPEALAVAITLFFVVFLATFFALAGWLAGRLRGHSTTLWLLLVLPSLWVFVEWLRGWLFSGFPWLSMGYSQIDLPLAGYAPVLGVFGLSFAVALSSGLLNLWPRPVAPMLLLLLWGGGFGLQQVAWTEAAADPVQVSLLQGNIPQQKKWLREMRAPSLQLYLDMTATVPDSRIVVWPETAVPAFDHEVETSLLQPLHESMAAQGRDVVLGIVAGGENGRYYNAMFSLGQSGRGRYYKRHLVPFGEYLPLDRWLRPVLDFIQIPMSDFSPGGNEKPLIELAGYPVGIDICYEDAYGNEIVRALPEAVLLINASNDAWFGDSLAPHQHLEIARMRALETGRYLLRATNTGISAIIDPRGELRGIAGQFEKAILTDQVTPMRGQTPYARWGNAGILVIASTLLLLGVGAGARTRRV